MIWQWVLFVAMGVLIVMSFITPAPQQQIGESSRIFYYHIPQAWLAVVAFATSMIYSIRYLKRREASLDDRAAIANALGLVFAILATVTGAMFAKVTWGTYWNWDPRQTSIFVLLLIYGAYFSLRGAVTGDERRAAMSAVYSIFAFPPAVFLMFVFPRLTPSLHPSDTIVDKNMKFAMTTDVASILFGSLVLFTVLYIWMFNLAARVYKMERARREDD
ncbi:cytochrome c biogenesis protein CcsA [bacterium]|nr:cytochrome c biogenesis protein CcsA [bacterium]